MSVGRHVDDDDVEVDYEVGFDDVGSVLRVADLGIDEVAEFAGGGFIGE